MAGGQLPNLHHAIVLTDSVVSTIKHKNIGGRRRDGLPWDYHLECVISFSTLATTPINKKNANIMISFIGLIILNVKLVKRFDISK